VFRNPENGRPSAAYAIEEREGEDEEDEVEEMKEERERQMMMQMMNSRERWTQRWRRLKDNSDTADPL